MKRITFASILIVSALLSEMQAADPQSVYRQADTVLRDSKSVSPEFLYDPANAELLALLRKKAHSGERDARLMLLRASDPEVTDYCLSRLRANHWSDSIDAAKDLGASGQLSLIPVLASDLNTDQSAEPTVLHSGEENFRIKPVSILATIVIRSLIINSSEFRPEVRAWATQLGGLNDPNRENARASLRNWWKQNESLLRAKQYSQAQVPVSP